MKLEYIKKYVEKELNIDITNRSRVRNFVYARTVFYELAYRYGLKDNGEAYSLADIGKVVGMDHTSVMHHRAKIFEHLKDLEPRVYRVYDNFKKLKKTDSDEDIQCKYNALMRDYIELFSNFNKLDKKIKLKESKIYLLIDRVNEDKIDMFIERVEPIIKMLNSAKF